LHAVVRGDVQGVGFRYFVADRARDAGLHGWVRNLPDGAVECVAEGPRREVEALLRVLERGPSSAEVQRVEADWTEPEGDLDEFQIKGWG
jgi:acylphosphatase